MQRLPGAPICLSHCHKALSLACSVSGEGRLKASTAWPRGAVGGHGENPWRENPSSSVLGRAEVLLLFQLASSSQATAAEGGGAEPGKAPPCFICLRSGLISAGRKPSLSPSITNVPLTQKRGVPIETQMFGVLPNPHAGKPPCK